MDLSLSGRTALITGASSGFGAHFARLFVREGARVVIGARRVDKISALAQELGHLPDGGDHRGGGGAEGGGFAADQQRRIDLRHARSAGFQLPDGR